MVFRGFGVGPREFGSREGGPPIYFNLGGHYPWYSIPQLCHQKSFFRVSFAIFILFYLKHPSCPNYGTLLCHELRQANLCNDATFFFCKKLNEIWFYVTSVFIPSQEQFKLIFIGCYKRYSNINYQCHIRCGYQMTNKFISHGTVIDVEELHYTSDFEWTFLL